MDEQWRELWVHRLQATPTVRGEAFAEVGHQMIALMHPYIDPCPCGCDDYPAQ